MPLPSPQQSVVPPPPDWYKNLGLMAGDVMGYGPMLAGKAMDYIFPSKQPLIQPQTAQNVITGLTSGGVETPGSATDAAQRYLANMISESTKGPNMAYMAAGLMGGMGAPRTGPSGITPELLEMPKAKPPGLPGLSTADEASLRSFFKHGYDPMGVPNAEGMETWAQIEQGKDLLKQIGPEAEANAPPIPDAVLQKLQARMKAKKAEGFFDPTPLDALPSKPALRPDPHVPEAEFPPLPGNGKLITIKRPDGTTYRAAMDTEQEWPAEFTRQLGISSGAPIHRVAPGADGPMWSTSMLDPGETIIED